MKERISKRQGVASIIVLVVVVFVSAAVIRQTNGTISAGQGAPPPQQEQFEGIRVQESFPVPGLPVGDTSSRPRRQSAGWTVLLDEDWEDGFDANKWLTVDRNGSQGGDYRWGLRDVENPLAGGQASAWSIGGGQNGENLNPAKDGYPPRVDSWLIHGPVDMTGALNAELSFNYSFQADDLDSFSVLVSTDGSNWEGKQTDSGGAGEWNGRNFSLNDFLGQKTVYLAFRFTSNDDGNKKKKAAFVDDIVLRADYGSKQYLPHISVLPTPTPPPTPTPSPTPPSGVFLDDFTSDISGWEARRARPGAIYGFRHRADEDGGRRGFLEVNVDSTDGFVILSPLVPAKNPPYNIELYAKLKDTKDRQMYGVVFGADWNGQACNAPSSPNCFNRYYELRVQYRNTGGKQFQEVKLKRIDSHDGNGEPQGPTLIDWKKGGNVGPDDWVEIDIYVSDEGTINISWNGKFIAQAKDATLLNQKYFGLLLITKENGNARVKYDYIKID